MDQQEVEVVRQRAEVGAVAAAVQQEAEVGAVVVRQEVEVGLLKVAVDQVRTYELTHFIFITIGN